MNCREKILSEDYMSILLDYVPEEADQEDEAFCYQQVDGTLGIYYLDRSVHLVGVLPRHDAACDGRLTRFTQEVSSSQGVGYV